MSRMLSLANISGFLSSSRMPSIRENFQVSFHFLGGSFLFCVCIYINYTLQFSSLHYSVNLLKFCPQNQMLLMFDLPPYLSADA